jgi:small neutral amino acid transporter SnatA (MarC family)
MKKTLKWTMILILLDMTIGTVIMYFFDVEKFAEQYPGQILLGVIAIGMVWMGIKKYKKLRFIDKRNVRIHLLEV